METTNSSLFNKLMWRPGMFGITKMDRFRHMINEKFRLNLKSYSDLYDWSIDNYPDFWEQFWIFAKIIHSNSYESIVDRHKPMEEIPEWFSGSKLNYTQNILENIENKDPNKVALFVASEAKPIIERVTFGQMKNRIISLISAMKRSGITVGDRVVGN